MSDDFFERLSQQIVGLRTELVDRIGDLQHAFAELRDDVAVGIRAGERLDRARSELNRGAAADAAAHRAERAQMLAERVAEMERQIQRLEARVAVLESKS